MKSGKRKKKAWKRVISKVTFVGQGFTRKPPKFERCAMAPSLLAIAYIHARAHTAGAAAAAGLLRAFAQAHIRL
jgi:hypothetical protein